MANTYPSALAALAISAPNCSSTRIPADSAGAPAATACRSPSKMTFFASEIRAASSGVGVPEMPISFLMKEARWSKARMYTGARVYGRRSGIADLRPLRELFGACGFELSCAQDLGVRGCRAKGQPKGGRPVRTAFEGDDEARQECVAAPHRVAPLLVQRYPVG